MRRRRQYRRTVVTAAERPDHGLPGALGGHGGAIVLADPATGQIVPREPDHGVDKVVDAANTRAVFVWGPERVRIEYVEHKPGFALT